MNQADPYEYHSNKNLVLYHFVTKDNGETRYFKFKPTAYLSQSPYFDMNDKNQNFNQPLLVSLPMLAVYEGLNSITELNYKHLAIKMKEGTTSAD